MTISSEPGPYRIGLLLEIQDKRLEEQLDALRTETRILQKILRNKGLCVPRACENNRRPVKQQERENVTKSLKTLFAAIIALAATQFTHAQLAPTMTLPQYCAVRVANPNGSPFQLTGVDPAPVTEPLTYLPGTKMLYTTRNEWSIVKANESRVYVFSKTDCFGAYIYYTKVIEDYNIPGDSTGFYRRRDWNMMNGQITQTGDSGLQATAALASFDPDEPYWDYSWESNSYYNNCSPQGQANTSYTRQTIVTWWLLNNWNWLMTGDAEVLIGWTGADFFHPAGKWPYPQQYDTCYTQGTVTSFGVNVPLVYPRYASYVQIKNPTPMNTRVDGPGISPRVLLSGSGVTCAGF